MKKFVLVVCAALFAMVANAQSVPSEFLGQTIGEKLRPEFVQESDGWVTASQPDGSVNYFVAGKEDLDITWNEAGIYVKDDVVRSVCFKAFGLVEDIATYNILEKQFYIDLKAKLDSKYSSFAQIPAPDKPGSFIYMSVDCPRAVVLSVDFTKGEEGVDIAILSVMYCDMEWLLGGDSELKKSAIAEVSEPELPVVQDTFFGLKLEQKVTLDVVKRAVGTKGTYLSTQDQYTTPQYSFSDLYFAGRKWDYANFCANANGELMIFVVYESLDTYGDDREYADELYNSVKDRLFAKYGEQEEQVEGTTRSVLILGKDGIGVSLSKRRGMSDGGSYRLYVELGYFDYGLMHEASAAQDDEL